MRIWVLWIALIFFSCEDKVTIIDDLVPFEMAGRAYWALQYVGGEPKAMAMLDMVAYLREQGTYENVWVHGKLMDGETLDFISEDSSRLYNDGVYIERFYEVGQVGTAEFAFYTQDGYGNRPLFPKWSMWITYTKR